jgi:hypothetical protein
MFVIYKKIASPETSPVLGPASANVSPTLAPKESPANDASSKMELQEMEPFSLYNCCCSARNNNAKGNSNGNNSNDKTDNNEENVNQIESQSLEFAKLKYEFGHATHYTYHSTTPRILNAFETGTPE